MKQEYLVHLRKDPMMKQILTALSLLCMFHSFAQVKERNLVKVMDLKLGMAEEEYEGTRGASLAWHPVQKKYYAAMAGNARFPLSVFDAKGKLLSPVDHSTRVDVRGLWYDPVRKTIGGNGFDTVGWFSYTLGPDGLVSAVERRIPGLNQPDRNSVGALNPKQKTVLFLDENEVAVYRLADAEPSPDRLTLYPGASRKPENPEADKFGQYNYTTLLYTGIAKAELGLLNHTENQLELYDIRTGLLTQVLQLPENASPESAFNLAYANGMFWLFNIELRCWTGYK